MLTFQISVIVLAISAALAAFAVTVKHNLR